MTVALLTHPKAIVAFGQFNNKSWSTELETLPCVAATRWVHPTGIDSWKSPYLVVTLHDGHLVEVHLAIHPSMTHALDTVTDAIAAAHHQPAPHSSLQHRYYSQITNLTPVGSSKFVALQVDSSDGRFVLSDAAVTHNCTSWFNDKNDRQLYELLPFLDSMLHVDDVSHVLQRSKPRYGSGIGVPPNLLPPTAALSNEVAENVPVPGGKIQQKW